MRKGSPSAPASMWQGWMGWMEVWLDLEKVLPLRVFLLR